MNQQPKHIDTTTYNIFNRYRHIHMYKIKPDFYSFEHISFPYTVIFVWDNVYISE